MNQTEISKEENTKEFNSKLSRDIRTPLNTIIGMANLARRNLDDREKADEYLDLVIHTSYHLLDQIEDALNIRNTEDAILHHGNTPFHLRELIDQTETQDLQNLIMHNQQLAVHYDPVYHENLIGDKDNLQKLFFNLLSNVSNNSPDGSTIHLHVRERLQLNLDSSFFDFSISGDTTSILEDSIIKSLVEILNGTMSSETSGKDGFSFSFSVELLIQNKKLLRQLEKQNHSVKGMTILVAEDNKLNQDIISELMVLENVTIDMADDGLEAVKLFINHKKDYYDAILMDIHMPVMNGYEATDCIRNCTENGGDYIPIIAVTSDALPEDIDEALRHNMNGHMSKPINFENLKEALSFWKNRT